MLEANGGLSIQWQKQPLLPGADGLMIEVHNDPECALCDGPQSLKPEKYDDLIQDIKQIIKITDKTLLDREIHDYF